MAVLLVEADSGDATAANLATLQRLVQELVSEPSTAHILFSTLYPQPYPPNLRTHPGLAPKPWMPQSPAWPRCSMLCRSWCGEPFILNPSTLA